MEASLRDVRERARLAGHELESSCLRCAAASRGISAMPRLLLEAQTEESITGFIGAGAFWYARARGGGPQDFAGHGIALWPPGRNHRAQLRVATLPMECGGS